MGVRTRGDPSKWVRVSNRCNSRDASLCPGDESDRLDTYESIHTYPHRPPLLFVQSCIHPNLAFLALSECPFFSPSSSEMVFLGGWERSVRLAQVILNLKRTQISTPAPARDAKHGRAHSFLPRSVRARLELRAAAGVEI